MTKETEQSQPPIGKLLADLANEIDGIADFGVTACLIDEGNWAGRHGYIVQRCGEVCLTVGSIVAFIDQSAVASPPHLLPLRSDLVAGSDQLLNALSSLEHFRTLPAEATRSAAESLRAGWEATHQSITQLAAAFGLLDESWCSEVRERQDAYRNGLEGLMTWLREASIAPCPPGQ
ncbi:MAG TPA: hypothetical protein VKA46_20360 [Gemmataceae bacterium]|nr:hypothetical protein [Gemmataceae bacterium]